jgi:glycosyltransferase involved in cell wall biosynthesis
MAPKKIAYIMSRFPNLTETFILREMVELEKRDWQISLYPLIYQNQPVVHPDAMRLRERAVHCSYLSWPVIKTNLSVFFKNPIKYISIFFRAASGNLSSPNFLIRTIVLFPKAVFFSQQMEKEQIIHIHAHYATHPALVAWVIHRFTGISYSLTVHAHDIFERKTFLAPKLKEAEFIVAISNFNRRFLINAVGNWVDPKIHIIHCGIYPQTYHPNQPRSFQNDRVFKILCIGSLEPYKGHPYLIQAARILRDKKIPYHVQIIGRGLDQNKLENQIQENQLEDCIELLGGKTQEEVATLLSQADCYVQPSIITATNKMEGIPVALMEAMASGVPVIASAISGIPELIQDRIDGLLVPPADPEALADTIESVYSHYSEALERTIHAKEKVSTQFDLIQNISQLEQLFDRQVTNGNL